MKKVYDSGLVIGEDDDFSSELDKQVRYIEKGVYFPAEVLNNRELTWASRYLFSLIKNFHSADRKCFASNSWFSQYLDCTEQHISNNIGELERLSYIKRQVVSFRYIDKSTGRHKYKTKRIIEIDNSYKYIYKPCITKVIVNNYSSNNHSSILSKDKIVEPPSVVYKRFFRKKPETTAIKNRLITYWNNLDWTRSHKDQKSKVYKQCSKLLNQLKQGKFSKGKELCPKWLVKHRHLVDKQWSEKELKQAIDSVSLYLKEGYWPENKDRMPKDLASLIYNPRSKKSLLLTAYENPSTLLSDQNLLPVEEDPDQTEMLASILYGGGVVSADDLPNDKLSELIHATNEIVKYHKWIKDVVVKKYDWLGMDLNPRGSLTKYYIEFLTEERYQNLEIEPYMLGPKSNSNNWYQYLGYLAECFVHGDKKDAWIFKKQHYKKG